MKRHNRILVGKIVFLAFLFVVSTGESIARSEESDLPKGAILVVPQTNISSSVVSRIQNWIRGNCPLVEVYVSNSATQNVAGTGEKKADKYVCTVKLISETGQQATNLFAVQGNVVTVNLRILDSDGADASSEKFLVRAEKESLKGAGLALGLKECPVPLCVMYAQRNFPELDWKGRNFCPPCYGRAESAVRNAVSK